MNPTVTRATISDLPLLTDLMRDFYAHGNLAFSTETQNALAALINDTSLGGAYLIRNADTLAGYFILTYGYSLERGGKTALLDELYIIPTARNSGLGKSAITRAATIAAQTGCRSLHLEVDHANEKARAFYERAGFFELSRGYLTLKL
jgi:ribosomal protein S18 acetylase RimI-like enzyme